RTSPHMGEWESPLTKIGFYVYDTVEKTLGLSGLKLFGLEVVLFVLLGAFWLQTHFGRKVARPASAMRGAALVVMAMAVTWELWGLARGGNLSFSMLQMRPLFLFGFVAWLFSYTFAYDGAPRQVMVMLVVVALIRAAVGVYFWSSRALGGAITEVGGG